MCSAARRGRWPHTTPGSAPSRSGRPSRSLAPAPRGWPLFICCAQRLRAREIPAAVERGYRQVGGRNCVPHAPAPRRLGSDTIHYRLLTTIMDPDQAPARDLAALYAQRWEFETALDELKTHQRGPRAVLRSQSPQGVEQEVWAFLLVHWAVRELMHTVAADVGVDPDRLSFLRSLRVIRRQVTDQAGFPPSSVWPLRSSTPLVKSLSGCCPPGGGAPTRGSSNARCPGTASNVPAIATGHSLLCPQQTPCRSRTPANQAHLQPPSRP